MRFYLFLVPTLEMELMITNVNWQPAFEVTNSSEYAELTQNITDAVSFLTSFACKMHL